jgi:S1-C subfamily serine protease
MRYATCLRRAGWITTIGIALSAGRSLPASDAPAAGEQVLTAQEDVPADEPTPSKEATEAKEPKRTTNVANPQGKVVIPKYRLGAALAPVPPALDEQFGLKAVGVLIQRIAPGGPADKAGIKRDDILLAVGDKPIKKYGDLVEASNASGGKMSVKLLRGGKTIIVAVTLDKHRKGDEKVFIPGNGAADRKKSQDQTKKEVK